MKKAILAIIILVTMTGCTTVEYRTPEGASLILHRTLTDAEIGNMRIKVERILPDGTREIKEMSLEGYKSNPNVDAMKAIAEGMAKGMMKGAKP